MISVVSECQIAITEEGEGEGGREGKETWEGGRGREGRKAANC